jgi:hypothetical protein
MPYCTNAHFQQKGTGQIWFNQQPLLRYRSWSSSIPPWLSLAQEPEHAIDVIVEAAIEVAKEPTINVTTK